MTTAFIAYDHCLASSIMLPIEMLNAAQDAARASGDSRADKTAQQDSRIVGRRKQIHCAGDALLLTSGHPRTLESPELVFLPAVWRNPLAVVRRERYLLALLRQWYESGARICAVGSGSLLLAESGLLDQRAATTHWSHMELFQRRYSQVQLKPDFLITQSDRLFCVSSVNSVADLVIYFIEEQYGLAVAKRVEGNFSPEVRKPYSSSLYRQGQQSRHTDEDIVRLQHWLHENFRHPVSAADMASMLGISTRSLNRRFRTSLDTTPIDYLNNLKMEHARELLKQSNLGAAEIALECGYNDAGYFSQSFRKMNGLTPTAYRNAVRAKLFSAG